MEVVLASDATGSLPVVSGKNTEGTAIGPPSDLKVLSQGSCSTHQAREIPRSWGMDSTH